MRNDLDVLAEIFSANSTAALSFNDRPAAEELLSTLASQTAHHFCVPLPSPTERVFARYRREGTPVGPRDGLRRQSIAPGLRATG